MLVQHPHLVHDVHVAIVVVEFTLAATRDAIRILSWLKANAPQARVVVVANKIASGIVEISRKDFETSIERKVDVVIPFDVKAASQAAKLGQPLAKATTSAKIAQPLAQLVNLTTSAVAAEDDHDEEADASVSLMAKLNLKTLLAKGSKAKAKA
jgi:pilus assembly protein CpaE